MGLPVALHKVLRVLSSLPRLERFVADVCEVILPASPLHYVVVWIMSASLTTANFC